MEKERIQDQMKEDTSAMSVETEQIFYMMIVLVQNPCGAVKKF